MHKPIKVLSCMTLKFLKSRRLLKIQSIITDCSFFVEQSITIFKSLHLPRPDQWLTKTATHRPTMAKKKKKKTFSFMSGNSIVY